MPRTKKDVNINPVAVRSSLSINKDGCFNDSDEDGEIAEDSSEREEGDEDQTVPGEEAKQTNDKKNNKRKRVYESTISKSANSLMQYVNDWRKEQATEISTEETEEAKFRKDLIDRMDTQAKLDKEKNDLIRELLAELKKEN